MRQEPPLLPAGPQSPTLLLADVKALRVPMKHLRKALKLKPIVEEYVVKVPHRVPKVHKVKRVDFVVSAEQPDILRLYGETEVTKVKLDVAVRPFRVNVDYATFKAWAAVSFDGEYDMVVYEDRLAMRYNDGRNRDEMTLPHQTPVYKAKCLMMEHEWHYTECVLPNGLSLCKLPAGYTRRGRVFNYHLVNPKKMV